MIELTKKIESTSQFLQDPEIHITGLAADGTRRMVINIPVVDEKGSRISVIVKEYDGEQFNEVYALYDCDKSLLSKVLEDSKMTVDISKLENDLINFQ